MAVEAVLEKAVRLNQESKSSGKYVVMSRSEVKPGSQSAGQGQDQVKQS